MKKAALRILAVVLGLYLAFCILLNPGLLLPPITLLIGWFPSSVRTVTKWHPSPGAGILFLIAAVLLLTGTHLFLRWLYRHLHGERKSASPPTWSPKWTLCGFGILFCTMLAIGSLVLITHQVFWISRSSAPLFSDPYHERPRLWGSAMSLQKAAEELQWDSAKIRDTFCRSNMFNQGEPELEEVQPVWIEHDANQLRAIILVPRQPPRRDLARLMILQRGTNLVTRRLDDLPQVLASFGIRTASEASTRIPPLQP